MKRIINCCLFRFCHLYPTSIRGERLFIYLFSQTMKLKLDLLKIVPLVTAATGIIVPIEMANAAGSPTAIKNAHPIEQKAATPATPGNSHSQAATPATHGTSSVPEMLLSPKAQQIEFFAFLGAIGLTIVVPELLYRPKKIAQNFLQLENSVREFPQEVSSKSKDMQSDKSEQNVPQAETHAPQFRLVEFSKETPDVVEKQTASITKETMAVEIVEEQTASIGRDLPDLKIIPNNIEPYTIPNREQSQFDINGQIEIDNWSQPGRKAS